MSVIDSVEQIGPSEIQQISQHLGVDEATARRAVQTALPAMVAGMAGQSQQPGGAASIEGAMGNYGNILGNLSGMLADGGGSAGGILGTILGRHQDTVHNEVAKSSGLDPAKTKQLLMILGPIILAALARHRGAAQPGSQPNVGDVLRQDAQNARNKPGMGGILGKILEHVETPR